MIKWSSSRLQVVVLLVCLLATSSARGQRKCKVTEFTIFDPKNPDVPVTCKTCPRCPAGQGLPVQCGGKVWNGTSTDCVPCKANETYSDSDDLSHCKSCNMCGKKIVLQHCTPKQNRKCGGCPPGYYLDHLDECKECHYCCDDVSERDRLPQCKDLGLPRNQQCEATDRNKLCKTKASLVNTTTVSPAATVTPMAKLDGTSISAVVPGGGNMSATNSTAETSKPIFILHGDADQGLNGRNSVQSKHDHSKKKQRNVIISGCIGAFVIFLVIIFLVVKLRHSIYRDFTHIYDSVERGESLQLTEQRTNGLVNNQPNVHGRESPSSEHQSTNTSTTASTESIHEDTVDYDVQRIPEERLVSDMEWLRDGRDNLMLFFVQNQLDPLETPQKKTWRSVGLALNVSSETLDLIGTCYAAQRSPTEDLLQHLKNRADAEPSVRTFVEALKTCGRNDVARSICNWPWDLEKNRERPTR